jgi:hypothetical protein
MSLSEGALPAGGTPPPAGDSQPPSTTRREESIEARLANPEVVALNFTALQAGTAGILLVRLALAPTPSKVAHRILGAGSLLAAGHHTFHEGNPGLFPRHVADIASLLLGTGLPLAILPMNDHALGVVSAFPDAILACGTIAPLAMPPA